MVAYFAGTILALLCLGRLANYVGRRPAAMATLLVMLVGCVVLLDVTGLGMLIAGRFLMGIGAGMASSALTTYIVDRRPRAAWLASSRGDIAGPDGWLDDRLDRLRSFGPVPAGRARLGLCVDGIAVGGLPVVDDGCRESGEPTRCVAVAAANGVGTAARTSVVAGGVERLRGHLGPGCLYQSFVPTIARDQLNSDNALVVSLLFAAYMAPGVAGAPLVGRLRPATAQRLGMVTFLLGVAGILASLAAASVPLLTVSTVVASLGQGMAVSASMRALLQGSTFAERPSLMAAIYLACYTGAMVPSIIAGQLSHYLGTVTIALGYGVLALVSTGITLICARNPSDA